MTGPPYHTPSEALADGKCPACLGGGWVVRFVPPPEHEGPCSLCGGTGDWPPDDLEPCWRSPIGIMIHGPGCPHEP